jgi:hypothetical protein
VAFGCATVAMVVGLVVAPRPAVTELLDLGVLADLVARVSRGEDVTYRAEYESSRQDETRRFETAITVLQREGVRAVSGGGTLTVNLSDSVVSCTETEDGPTCQETPRATSEVPAAAAVAESIRAGSYRLRDAGTIEVAGERGRCFDLSLAAGDPIASLGFSTSMCLTPDGIPLSSEIARPGAIDRRTATKVARDVSPDDVAAMIDPFDPSLAEAGERDAET